MPHSREKQNKLCTAALDAEESGELATAEKLYRQSIDCDRENPTPYLFFGYVLEKLHRNDAATEAWSLAADLDPRVINAWRSPNIAADIRCRSKAANLAVRSHFVLLHKAAIDEYLRLRPDANITRIGEAIWCQTHDKDFEYQHPRQRPQLFFVPDLTPIEVYEPAVLPWQAALESATDDIRQEFLAAREQAADEEQPYLKLQVASLGEDWQPIANSLNWGSYHLYKKGIANPRLLDLFPATLKALESVPLCETANGPSEILFSVLQGGKRIPPHFGVSNTDVTVHLPLIVPPQSAIRVLDDTYAWQEGRVFAFDDAFEHESWNDSNETRVNLLFEAWHPDLTGDERQAITAVFEARASWNRSRRI